MEQKQTGQTDKHKLGQSNTSTDIVEFDSPVDAIRDVISDVNLRTSFIRLGANDLMVNLDHLVGVVDELSKAKELHISDIEEVVRANLAGEYEDMIAVFTSPADMRTMGMRRRLLPSVDPGRFTSPHNYTGSTAMLPGLMVVLGSTGAGKTEYIKDKLKPHVNIRLSEPNEYVDTLPNAMHPADLVEAIVLASVVGLLGYSVAIDSFRGLVLDLDGPATRGGIIGTLYSTLTNINNYFASLGVLVAAGINPMVAEDSVEILYTNIAASVTASQYLVNHAIHRTQIRGPENRIMRDGEVTESSFSGVQQYPGKLSKAATTPLDKMEPREHVLGELPEDEDAFTVRRGLGLPDPRG